MNHHIYLDALKMKVPLSAGLQAYIETCQQEIHFKKHDILLKSQLDFNNWSFLQKGTLRIFTIRDEDQEELSLFFCMENSFLIVPEMNASLYTNGIQIEFLSDSIINSIPDRHLNSIFKYFSEASQLNLILNDEFTKKLFEHITLLISEDGQTRYLHLMKNNPTLFNIAKLKDIASFLGIHPKTLSILRRRKDIR